MIENGKEEEVRKEEVILTLKKLKNEKAMGGAGISTPAEVWKYGREGMSVENICEDMEGRKMDKGVE